MLTQLPTLKARLAIPDADTTNDALLTAAIKAVSVRFDKECNRALARTENATFEFSPRDTELSPPAYPIESVSKFELKTDETEGWIEQPDIKSLIRNACVLSLAAPGLRSFSGGGNSQPSTARMTYSGGYVLPGDPDPQPSTPNSQPLRLPPPHLSGARKLGRKASLDKPETVPQQCAL